MLSFFPDRNFINKPDFYRPFLHFSGIKIDSIQGIVSYCNLHHKCKNEQIDDKLNSNHQFYLRK